MSSGDQGDGYSFCEELALMSLPKNKSFRPLYVRLIVFLGEPVTDFFGVVTDNDVGARSFDSCQ